MKNLTLGNTGLTVSELGMGCSRIGGIFSHVSEQETISLLHAAHDYGVTLYDTADMYSQGESERLLGKAFSATRDKVVIASKVGYKLPSRRMLMDRLKPVARPLLHKLGISRSRLPQGVRGELAHDFSPAAIRQGIEGSLRRLQTDYLDLYLLHGLPAQDFEEATDCLSTLQKSGAIRHYGVSCDELSEVETCMAPSGVSVLQLQLSLLHQEAAGIVPSLQERGVGLVARQCFASGLLAKEITELNFIGQPPERLTQARAAEFLAQRLQRSLPELALRFSLDVCERHVTLVGIRTREQLDDVIRMQRSKPLTQPELSAVEDLQRSFDKSAQAASTGHS